MADIGDRVREARLARGLSLEQVAKAADNIAYQTVQNLEKKKAFGTKHLNAIARSLGVNALWLEKGEGARDTGSDPAPLAPVPTAAINIQSMPKDLPVMGNGSCGDDGLFELNGQVLDHVRRPPRLMGVRDGYALWVQGESMAPWREHGGLVVVHPHQPVKINDYVVVQLKAGNDGEQVPAYIKRLVKRTAANLVLLQHNPKKEISIPQSKILAIHKILDWDEAMGI
jgi:phage repressor protein C with HTH and peptisase S24 domain